MLQHPTSGGHLPAEIVVLNGSQAGQKCVDERGGGKHVKQSPL